ncbi:MAG: methylglyoxal synthase [Ruminococcaceae bacterium]|nr:methylglyoxal synthase [Oscillospiraceae bacterium]
MKICIVASNEKKELMVQLCIAYCGILSKHTICATAATGNIISESTGLEVERMLTGSSGGIEQVASRISCNEVDVLLYFRSSSPYSIEQDLSNDVLRLCDIYNIPVATNLATAEAILLALDRGDLDWRNNIRM